MNITVSELSEIYEDYQKWMARRPYELDFSVYLAEQEMKVKAKMYDQWIAESDSGPTETGNSQRQTEADRPVLTR